MLLNSRQNGFIFNFPKGFFSKKLETKYHAYVKRMPIPYDNLRDFMNSAIQQVSFPTFQSIDHVEQTRPGGYKQNYKSATNIQNLIRRDFNVTFKLGEGLINYWIMYESMVNFLDFNNILNCFFLSLAVNLFGKYLKLILRCLRVFIILQNNILF